MPPVKSTVKSAFGQAMGPDGAEAVLKHRTTEPRVTGFVNLPPGVNGVARLTQCYVSQYKEGENKGKWFFRAAGNVVEPLTAVDLQGNRMRVKGLQTTLMVGPIEDTVIKSGKRKGEVESKGDILDRILNELKLLLGMGAMADVTVDDIPDLCAQAVEAAPYFSFVTSPRIAQQDDPKSGVKKGDVTGAWENWRGTEGLEDYVEEEVQSVGKDNTGPAPSTNGKAPHAGNGKASATVPPTVPKNMAPPKSTPKQPEPEPEPDPEPFVPETCEDLDLLLLDADSNSDTNAASQSRIAELGVAAGLTMQAQAKISTWGEIVDAIKTAVEPADEDEPPELKQGDWVGFQPRDPVTKKKVKDPVRCQVVKLGEDKCDLKAGKASYKNISLSDLLDDPGE